MTAPTEEKLSSAYASGVSQMIANFKVGGSLESYFFLLPYTIVQGRNPSSKVLPDYSSLSTSEELIVRMIYEAITHDVDVIHVYPAQIGGKNHHKRNDIIGELVFIQRIETEISIGQHTPRIFSELESRHQETVAEAMQSAIRLYHMVVDSDKSGN